MRNRWTRLVFVIIPKAFYFGFVPDPYITTPMTTFWGILTFSNNYVGVLTDMWSVAVEMQFYIFSPIIVYSMIKTERPWLICFIIGMFSVFLNFGLLYKDCPKSFEDP